MGISERREREKIERRKTIIRCARELILSQGIQRVSMEDIARKAELSKATVYLYFSSKEILFNEICEEAARVFLTHLSPLLENGAVGMAALRIIWRRFVELFGSFEDMIIVYTVRNFINPGLPMVSVEEEYKSPHTDIILETVKRLIEQCKAEGVFDPKLDSLMATNLLLSMFTVFIENAVRISPEERNPLVIMEELKSAFQRLVYGFAKEGVSRSSLDITGTT